jgi:hypothetical protein
MVRRSDSQRSGLTRSLSQLTRDRSVPSPRMQLNFMHSSWSCSHDGCHDCPNPGSNSNPGQGKGGALTTPNRRDTGLDLDTRPEGCRKKREGMLVDTPYSGRLTHVAENGPRFFQREPVLFGSVRVGVVPTVYVMQGTGLSACGVAPWVSARRKGSSPIAGDDGWVWETGSDGRRRRMWQRSAGDMMCESPDILRFIYVFRPFFQCFSISGG